jgi:hypothetical protein
MSRRDLWGIKYKRLIDEGEGLLLSKNKEESINNFKCSDLFSMQIHQRFLMPFPNHYENQGSR